MTQKPLTKSTKELLVGTAVLLAVAGVAVTACSGPSEEQAPPDAPVAVQPSATPNTATAVQERPTAADAKDYIQRVDAALHDGDRLSAMGGNLAEFSRQSVRMRGLSEDGQRFGKTLWDKPFGYCFAAGVRAQAAWQAAVHAASGSVPPDASARAQYDEARRACLEAAS